MKAGLTETFAAFNALNNHVLVLDNSGHLVFANKKMLVLIEKQDLDGLSIFDLLQDHRLSESLREHIGSTNKSEYLFSVLIKGKVYHFQVILFGDLYVCNGQSEDDIEQMYQLQVASRKKMLDIKTKLLAVCMLDKNDFDTALFTILQSAADILKCERVSFWEVAEQQDCITCKKLYLRSKKGISELSGITEIRKDESKAYFDYINKEYAFILADDIATHPATKDFFESYSKPQNITSLLDVPVWHNNRLHGIICCEQVGLRKKWHLEDAQFLLSLSDSVALCLQTRDRLNAEEQLKEANSKLLRSNNELENFATIASHDIKSPLRSIVSFLTLLKKQHSNTMPGQALEYIDYSLQNATHLTQLINGLLSYAKVDQQLDAPVRVSCEELLKKICKDQEEFILERKGEVHIETGMPVLNIQYGLLYPLFANIVHNAIKYSHTDKPPVLEITVHEKDGYYVFRFSDNGIGIDDQYAEKIFSLFGRLHSLDEFDGTGIGLATCKKIAELFGGKIAYTRRTIPEGSIFEIFLPVTLRY